MKSQGDQYRCHCRSQQQVDTIYNQHQKTVDWRIIKKNEKNVRRGGNITVSIEFDIGYACMRPTTSIDK